MKRLYCYRCGIMRDFSIEEPRYDVDEAGKVVITDITCTVCNRRIRFLKRLAFKEIFIT